MLRILCDSHVLISRFGLILISFYFKFCYILIGMSFFSDSMLLISASLVIEGLGDLQSQASVLNTVLYVYLVGRTKK